MNRIILKAPAKINIFLEIERRRPDGYHDISSVFRLIDLSDEITVEKIPSGVEFYCDEPLLNTPDNLAAKAARAIIAAAGIKGGARIKLSKKIPWASGLGGASSDAATAIKAVLALYNAHMDNERLAETGKALGADVPFFLSGAPTAAIGGIGEKIMPLSWPEAFYIVVVKPTFGISTKEAYARLVFPLTDRRQIDKMTAAIVAGKPPEIIAAEAFNRFEGIAAADRPEIPAIKTFLLSFGALCALMSGSGSAVFGVFKDKASARKASEAAPSKLGRAYLTETL